MMQLGREWLIVMVLFGVGVMFGIGVEFTLPAETPASHPGLVLITEP